MEKQLPRTNSFGNPVLSLPNSPSASPGDTLATHVMYSNDLERKCGITLWFRFTSINYQGNLLNIADTPGHADFGGEVKRIMSMADSDALIVDATEGPMAQTRFVLSKALSRGLRGCEQQTSRVPQVESDLFDLFATLSATDGQARYPLLYAPAKQGWASTSSTPSSTSMETLFDLILSHVPLPHVSPPPTHYPMLSVQFEHDPYLGLLQLAVYIAVKKILIRKRLEREETGVAGAGEIASIAGIKGLNEGVVTLSFVLMDGTRTTTPIDPPTISFMIRPNDSPFSGEEGTKFTSQLICQHLLKASQTNLALKVLPGPAAESLEIRGFDLCVRAPKVVSIPDEDNPGQWLELIEECNTLVKERQVYPGMIIGECNKPQTLHVNPRLKKQLTNCRMVMVDDKLVLGSLRVMGLEEMLSHMSEEGMVEITPMSVRLRKGNSEG
ncbi:hypothetical protein Agabi119p4_4918 [Agaricus bisporus var. burnettii]|uniref:Tr-type G domain-containing protein n=1 Tax=Agaricus bisporus var. burnettii TaxID=192524 RepID=A0A8H7F444_AGABI|nr:hypothetical protein Agabi119p4_4918 [Agaricus bisporus var. burnettii]